MLSANHHRFLWSVAALCAVVSWNAAAQSLPADQVDFFEKKIRPLLAENCFECHSAEKKTKGGLRLDTRDGWAKGGDSGPALVPGDVEASRLITAVRYRDKEFQMPPKKKLSDEQVADLEKWVKLGAPDPRTGSAVATTKKTGLNLEEGRRHWAYQPPKKTALPKVKNKTWARNDIDRFILAKLEAKGIKPAPDADKATLARRAYFDLAGLPPTPEQVDEFVNDNSPEAFARLVDRLLAAPQFGERWGRHWLDVVRYAESLTLRGFVFHEAWRYRDYVVESFNRDQPYDRFIQEHVAGDLLPADSLAQRRRQLTATTFLTLGNSNLEEQDKAQLRMDVVDEQLDTIGKAFLAQTIGCARCHDHKFDPIPTRDYYALAGILRSVTTITNANVSGWLEFPLPVEAEQEIVFKQQETQVAALQAKIKAAKAEVAKLAAAPDAVPMKLGALATKDLPGVVVDDLQAKRVGDWKPSQFTGNFIGDGYLYDGDIGKGTKTLTFLPELPHAGKYEVRLAYVPYTNRAMDVPVTVFSADGEQTVHINQRETPPLEGRFVSLGQHRFELNGQGFVIVANEGTKGHVVADAVQFIPVELLNGPSVSKSEDAGKPASALKKSDAAKAAKNTSEDVKELEVELKRLTESGPKRPLVMSVKEAEDIGDAQIHVRGSVHNLGDKTPRGFLQIATFGAPPKIPVQQSGRRELGEWLVRRDNPLPARVMANRVWHWLLGVGLVRTMDNFGTTGEAPSHPELLDYLAMRFMDEGWSVKKLVREIMLSRTYQLSSSPSHQSSVISKQSRRTGSLITGSPITDYWQQSTRADPENRTLWRANRRRLDAECIRDTMLFVSGQLQLDMGGPTIKPGTAADYGYKHSDSRRSLYAPVFRNALPELFEAFDFADPSMVTGRRNTSTVAPQALFMMNHPFALEQAKAAARRTLATDGDDATRIERAYRVTLGRAPTKAESKLALGYVTLPADGKELEARRLEAWAQFYQALFASMDFRYLN